jgi:pilus assembly protein CpaF
MGAGLASGLGSAMGLIARVGHSIALGDTRLESGAVEAEAERLLRLESPWRVGGSVGHVVSHVLGLGPLQALVDDPLVTDVLVNGPEEVWVDRGEGLVRSEVHFESPGEIVTVVERAVAPLGLRIDRTMPMVDARLPDGSRLHAVLPPASVTHPLVAIRRFTQRVTDLEGLIDAGTATSEQVGLLLEAVRGRKTIVVSGATGAGKTTLLNLLGAHIPTGERVVTIEDAAELWFPGHLVRLETRRANAEGAGEITISDLLRSALRLRPDRIIVGEVRGAEAFHLITALNTGHRGSMTTVHANSPEEAMWRLETLALSAGVGSETAVLRQLDASVDLVVQIEKVPGGRRISSIAHRRRHQT